MNDQRGGDVPVDPPDAHAVDETVDRPDRRPDAEHARLEPTDDDPATGDQADPEPDHPGDDPTTHDGGEPSGDEPTEIADQALVDVPDPEVGTAAARRAGPGGHRARVSRWDRPAPPRDWRFVVGAVGRCLIVVGLLMFGFVAYQLWGTGIETARAQNRLESQFEALLDETLATTPTTITTGAPAPATSSVPVTGGPTTTAPAPVTTLAPDEPAVTTTTVAAPPPVPAGGPLARLEIPRMGKVDDSALYVVSGVDVDSLQKGPGHYPDTPMPGQLGNAAIAGHRTTWGEPFSRIDELQPGDEIVVTMLTGERYVYAVADTLIVEPSDYGVVQTTDPTVAQLTLTSCHPRFSARQRIVVQAFLVAEESSPVGEPATDDIATDEPDPDHSSGDTSTDTTIESDDDPAVSTTPTAPTASTLPTPPTMPSAPPTTGVAGTPGLPSGQTVGADGLTEGWFHDRAAWPHIAAWGVVCAAIAFVAARLSRRFRSYLRGWGLAIVPFLLSLYFLYQNVNRLLPPGL